MWVEMVHPSGGKQLIHASRQWIMEANGWKAVSDDIRTDNGRTGENVANVDGRPVGPGRRSTRRSGKKDPEKNSGS